MLENSGRFIERLGGNIWSRLRKAQWQCAFELAQARWHRGEFTNSPQEEPDQAAVVRTGLEVIPVKPKKRFVWFEGSSKEVADLKSKCRYPFLPYPTRDGSERGKCSICGAVFPSNRQLRKHIAQVHGADAVVAQEQD